MSHSSSHHTREGITEKGPKPEGFSNPPGSRIGPVLCGLDRFLPFPALFWRALRAVLLRRFSPLFDSYMIPVGAGETQKAAHRAAEYLFLNGFRMVAGACNQRKLLLVSGFVERLAA